MTEVKTPMAELIVLKDYPIDYKQDIKGVDIQTMEDANIKILKNFPKQQLTFFNSAVGDRINAELKEAKTRNLDDQQFKFRNGYFAFINMILYFTFHNFGKNVADLTRQYSYVSVKISNGWDALEGVAWQSFMDKEKRYNAQIIYDPITTLNYLDIGFQYEIDNKKTTKATLVLKANPTSCNAVTPPRQIAMKLLSAP